MSDDGCSWTDRIKLVTEYFTPPTPDAPLPQPTLPPEALTPAKIEISSGVVVINGVALPQLVVNELHKLQLPIEWYTHGQLEEAVQACAVDCTLVDDDDGVTFEDKLSLSSDEKAAKEEKRGDILEHYVSGIQTFGVAAYGNSFAERLKLERVRQLTAALSGSEHHQPIISTA